MNLEKLTEEIHNYIKTNLKKERYEHSVRVAETSALMCNLYNLDSKKGYFAGLAHDMCKNLSHEELLEEAKKDGLEITEQELNKPSLLHGRAAAIRLINEFNVTDDEIIQAVRHHTMGAISLCDLGKIVYSADKIEPGRPQSTKEYRDQLFSKSLNELTIQVLEENINYLEKKGKAVAPVQEAFLEFLKQQEKQ